VYRSLERLSILTTPIADKLFVPYDVVLVDHAKVNDFDFAITWPWRAPARPEKTFIDRVRVETIISYELWWHEMYMQWLFHCAYNEFDELLRKLHAIVVWVSHKAGLRCEYPLSFEEAEAILAADTVLHKLGE